MDPALATTPCPQCRRRVPLDGVRFELRCASCHALVLADTAAFFAARAPRRAAVVAPARPTREQARQTAREDALAALAGRIALVTAMVRAATPPRRDEDDELAFDAGALVVAGVTLRLAPSLAPSGSNNGDEVRLSLSQYVAAARAAARIDPLALRSNAIGFGDDSWRRARRVRLARLGAGLSLAAICEDDGYVTVEPVASDASWHDDWRATPWLWQGPAAAPGGRAQRWGVDGLPATRAGRDARSGTQLETWRARCERGTASAGERAACATVLQDLGRVDEALALYDIELVRASRVALTRAALAPPDTVAASALDGARDTLWRVAPWRLRAALAAHAPARAVRLGLSPGAEFALAARGPRARTLALSFGADYDLPVAPQALWTRPLEIDLLRFRLTAPHAVPR